MKTRTRVLITAIAVLPLVLLTVAAVRLARHEQIVVRQQFRSLMEQRLAEINRGIARHFADVGRDLQRLTAIDEFDPDLLRQRTRRDPRLLQLFVLTSEGVLQYPDPSQPLNGTEQGFLRRAAGMFANRDLASAVALAESPAETAQESSSTSAAAVANAPTMPSRELPAQLHTFGWFVWYWDRGLNLIYWQRRPTGQIVGAALERSRWIADLIGELPETEGVSSFPAGDESFEYQIRIEGAAADTVYQWGRLSHPEEDAVPFCEVPVADPLGAWRLQCLVPAGQPAAGTRGSLYLSLTSGLLAAAVATAGLTAVLFRDYARDMREAAQQLSFVNQVSHELKTPLTNIRMYAELLSTDLDHISPSEADRPRQRLEVILSEGQRLSRLISNVLTFARQTRRTLQPHPQPQIPDELIERIVNRFRPALSELQIDVRIDADANRPVQLDPDFLEQILGNLISNVEKYASSGRLLRITSRLTGEMLLVQVQDAGPGVERGRRDEIFRPFSRLSRDVSYAAGTGIGLSIARELARLHGGDVVLLDGTRGCCFEVRLRCATDSGQFHASAPGEAEPEKRPEADPGETS